MAPVPFQGQLGQHPVLQTDFPAAIVIVIVMAINAQPRSPSGQYEGLPTIARPASQRNGYRCHTAAQRWAAA